MAPGPGSASGPSGPLHGLRVLDFTGLGPGPYCAGLLGDLGADVVRIERPAPRRFSNPEKFVPHRSRRSIVLDLRAGPGVDVARRLIETADVLIEGNRPGVMERLGLGPDECLEHNPRLVYARLTGWGQSGDGAGDVGHDVNYLALVGALDRFRRASERPLFPLNLAADYGGGGLFCAFGVVCAIVERATSGRGQVVDAAMIDGVAGQLGLIHAYLAMGRLTAPGTNFNDTGSHWYEVYETSDGRFLAIGALEAKFYEAVLQGLGLAEMADLPHQMDQSSWPRMKALFAEIIGARDLDHWAAVFDGVEACVTPVLTLEEAFVHRHHRSRNTFVERDGVMQADVAPRFSRTPGRLDRPPPAPGAHTDEILLEVGLTTDEIATLRALGVAE